MSLGDKILSINFLNLTLIILVRTPLMAFCETLMRVFSLILFCYGLSKSFPLRMCNKSNDLT